MKIHTLGPRTRTTLLATGLLLIGLSTAAGVNAPPEVDTDLDMVLSGAPASFETHDDPGDCDARG